MHRINLAKARDLIDAALAEAARLGLKPLTLGVFDPAGSLIALHRQDGAPTIGPQVVAGKVGGALALGVPSRRVGELTVERPHVLGAIGALAPHGMVPAAGALLVADENGVMVGAIAASGDTSDNDELCVAAAIKAVGLRALG